MSHPDNAVPLPCLSLQEPCPCSLSHLPEPEPEPDPSQTQAFFSSGGITGELASVIRDMGEKQVTSSPWKKQSPLPFFLLEKRCFSIGA